jgi:hypothetical protein
LGGVTVLGVGLRIAGYRTGQKREFHAVPKL